MAFGTGSEGKAGYGTVDEVATVIMQQVATGFFVRCSAFSANSVLINVPLLHGTDWLKLEAGDTFPGRFGERSWSRQTVTINAKALDASAVASITWGITAML